MEVIKINNEEWSNRSKGLRGLSFTPVFQGDFFLMLLN